MNAMLEPKIVAASTHGLDLFEHGTPGVPDPITASSHGCLITILDADGIGTIPDDKVYELRMKRYGSKDDEQKVVEKRVGNFKLVRTNLLRDITLR